MKCVVMRPFSGPGGIRFQIGERVDTSEWKNREALITQRYIQPARLSSGTERKGLRTVEDDFRPASAMASTTSLKKKKKRILAEV